MRRSASQLRDRWSITTCVSVQDNINANLLIMPLTHTHTHTHTHAHTHTHTQTRTHSHACHPIYNNQRGPILHPNVHVRGRTRWTTVQSVAVLTMRGTLPSKGGGSCTANSTLRLADCALLSSSSCLSPPSSVGIHTCIRAQTRAHIRLPYSDSTIAATPLHILALSAVFVERARAT